MKASLSQIELSKLMEQLKKTLPFLNDADAQHIAWCVADTLSFKFNQIELKSNDETL